VPSHCFILPKQEERNLARFLITVVQARLFPYSHLPGSSGVEGPIALSV
jgi:hypothetical protein